MSVAYSRTMPPAPACRLGGRDTGLPARRRVPPPRGRAHSSPPPCTSSVTRSNPRTAERTSCCGSRVHAREPDVDPRLPADRAQLRDRPRRRRRAPPDVVPRLAAAGCGCAGNDPAPARRGHRSSPRHQRQGRPGRAPGAPHRPGDGRRRGRPCRAAPDPRRRRTRLMGSLLDSFSLDGKVAIVTGASSGLGVAFAAGLAEAGADIAICARRVEKLEETKARSRRSAAAASPSRPTSRTPRTATRVVEETVAELGKVDVLINNAGVGTAVPATRETPGPVPPGHRHQPQRLVLHGAGVRPRDAAGGGSIVNIGSVLGSTTAVLPQAAYAASQGRDHRPDPRPRPAVDGPQGHPRQRAGARASSSPR